MSLNVGCISGTVIVQWLFLSVMAWMTCAAYTLYGKVRVVRVVQPPAGSRDCSL